MLVKEKDNQNNTISVLLYGTSNEFLDLNHQYFAALFAMEMTTVEPDEATFLDFEFSAFRGNIQI